MATAEQNDAFRAFIKELIENKKKGLGRGLSSLIGDIKSAPTNNKLLISDVIRSKLQPRKNFDKGYLEDLTNSIKDLPEK